MDTSKAFDSCNWLKLFEKLGENESIPKPILKFLIDSYLKSKSTVVYGNAESEPFNLTQGVKQGSILSPYLYNKYTETLIAEILNLQIGTHLPDGTNTSLIAFADDLILMSPTLQNLQTLLDKCAAYGINHNLKFNELKTQFIISGKSDISLPFLRLENNFVLPQNTLKHLGFQWKLSPHTKTLQLQQHEYRLQEMWAVTSSLISAGVRRLSPTQIISLFKSLVVPRLLYGVELVRLTATSKEFLDRQARCALKSLFGVSKHSKNLINRLYNIADISQILDNKKLSLLKELIENNNTRHYTLYITTLGKDDRGFSTIEELNKTCEKYEIDLFESFIKKQSIKLTDSNMPDEDLDQLRLCVENWHIYESRLRFREILEELTKR